MEQNRKNFTEQLPYDCFTEHKRDCDGKDGVFHTHRALEVLFIKSSDAVCEVSGQKFNAEASSVFIFNNSESHRIICPRGHVYDRYVLYFKPEYIDGLSSRRTDLLTCFFCRPTPGSCCIKLDNEQSERFEALMKKAEEKAALKSDVFGAELEQKFAVGELLLTLNKLYISYYGISSFSGYPDYRIVYNTIDYINCRLSEELTLSELAENNFVSKNRLCELFSGVMKCSPMRYVRHCRILKAKEYLVRGMSVDDTCGLVGFKNLSHFSRSFKEEVGIGPKKYSSGNRKQPS